MTYLLDECECLSKRISWCKTAIIIITITIAVAVAIAIAITLIPKIDCGKCFIEFVQGSKLHCSD